MTLARRVAALEVALTPTQLVLRWLDEAHGHGSLTAYVGAILDDDPEDFPLNRLCREAVASARSGIKGRSKEQTDASVSGALQQTAFRFELVMGINVRTHEIMDRQVLVDAVLSAHLATLSSGNALKAASDPGIVEQIAVSRDTAMRYVIELHAMQEARSLAESRYLDSHQALFPDALRDWEAQVTATERLAVMADRLAELEGAPAMEIDVAEAAAARVPVLLDGFVEPAKATALEKLGAGDRAMRVATRWVRAIVSRTKSPSA